MIMRSCITPIFIWLFLLQCAFPGFSQPPIADPSIAARSHDLKDANNMDQLRQQLQIVVDSIAKTGTRVVALGEGTHGTKEFNLVRLVLTQLLVQQKGFNCVALENSYGDTYMLNRQLNMPADLRTSMKENLFGIYQTTEYESLFRWMKDYNAGNNNTLQVKGIDYFFGENTARALSGRLQELNNREGMALGDSLARYAYLIDSMGKSLNTPKVKFDRYQYMVNGITFNRYRKKIDSVINNSQPLQHDQLLTEMRLNLSYIAGQFERENQQVSSRDRKMGEMVCAFLKEDNTKVIIWAHNVHVANKELILDGYPVGGMGAHIKRHYPTYFIIGTMTYSGSYSATQNQFITNQSIFDTYRLKAAANKSWEGLLASQPATNFYLPLMNMPVNALSLRVVGYRPAKSNYTSPVSLKDIFDAVIFLKSTTAAQHF
jgi:erythromycin esterase